MSKTVTDEINEFNFAKSTVETLLTLCCNIQTKEEATKLMKRYREVEPKFADKNLGYILGYVEPPEERQRLYGLFPVNHPIFGKNFGRKEET